METNTDYKQRYEESQRRYQLLREKVKQMMETQKMYFRSNKDFQLLKKSKALEAEVDSIINPKPSAQASMDFLGA